jgi:hypothetical protein
VDSSTRRLTGIGLALTVVATVFAVNADWIKAGISAAGITVCLLWGFWPSLPFVKSWRRRRAEGKRAAEQERAYTERVTEQGRLRPILATWEEFLTSTGNLRFYELRGPVGLRPEPITDTEWNAWNDAIGESQARAAEIEEPLRLVARQYLERLAAVSREDIGAGFQTYHTFNDWLMMKNAAYVEARRRVGLPLPDRSNGPR